VQTEATIQGDSHRAAVDRTHSAPTRILMVVANPDTNPALGWPVGFWAAELTHPYYEFTEAGYEVVLASPRGGRVEMDALSDPRDDSGWSAEDLISMGFLHTPALTDLLGCTPRLADLDPADFAALVICGGQAPMFNFRADPDLRRAILAFWTAEKLTVAFCHGTAALVDVRLPDGSYLIAGRTMTGFSNVEEDYSDRAVGRQVMPWRIEDTARERGANYLHSGLFKPFAVRDGRLITGQQQYSGRKVAQLVIETLGT
jgi:putative intracellular protease/amidase